MDLEHSAIERLKMASEMSLTYYNQPLIITTSGGKDSDICLELARRAGIPYEVMHNLTTADAPQTVYRVRDQFRNLELAGIKCTVSYPVYRGERTSLWKLIEIKMHPPTRLARYCCDVLKERGGRDRMIITGVRWAESISRKNKRGIYESVPSDVKKKIILNNDNDDARQLFENCRLKAKRVCNPIINWEDRDVWDFIRSEHLKVNPLYDMGFDRVGCIGCPMADKKRYFEFCMFPAYERMWRRAFARMLEARKAAGKVNDTWSTVDDVWHWWMEEDPNQVTFDQLAEMESEEDDR